jgi:hypothetical protein
MPDACVRASGIDGVTPSIRQPSPIQTASAGSSGRISSGAPMTGPWTTRGNPPCQR